MKTIHIISNSGLGGVQAAAQSLKNSELGNKIDVIYLNEEFFFSTLKKLFNADFLIFSLWKTTGILVLCRVLSMFCLKRPKFVFFLHSTKNAHLVDSICTTIGIFFSDYIFADSQSTVKHRSLLLKLKKTKVISMRLKFQTDDQTKTRKFHNLNFVFWGRIHPVKNIEKSIEFIRTVAENHPNQTSFSIYGTGNSNYLKKLKEDNQDLVNSGILQFFAPIRHKDIPRFTKRMSFFLSTSNYEGFSMSVLEGMSLGLIPVIAPVGESKSFCVHAHNSIFLDEFTEYFNSSSIEDLMGLSSEAILTSDTYAPYPSSLDNALCSIGCLI